MTERQGSKGYSVKIMASSLNLAKGVRSDYILKKIKIPNVLSKVLSNYRVQ